MGIKNKLVKARVFILIILILLLLVFCFRGLGGLSEEIYTSSNSVGSEEPINMATGRALGLISLIPAILTVILAFATKAVLPSLFAGLASGAVILAGVFGSGDFFKGITSSFTIICDTILDTASDSFQMAVIIMCLAIGGMVEVINVAGGFSAIGRSITHRVNTPKKASLMTQLMGVCVFFDDYANSLITGPVMKNITDKQGVSREKLAYLVDSTAAPIAGIAIISSWIAAELAAIESGFEIAGISGSAYSYFLESLPFCFYNFLAIGFMFMLTAMGREYGPMLKAERRARAGEPLKPGSKTEAVEEAEPAAGSGSIWTMLIPVFILLIYAFVGFYVDGIQNAVAAGVLPENIRFSFANVSTAFSYADTVNILMQASILASLAAVAMACISGKMSIGNAIDTWVKGVSDLLPTALILIFAWSLSDLIGQLGAAYYLVDLVTLSVPMWLLPMLIFLTCCLISFAAGSFGCMVIVMPIAVPIANQASLLSGQESLVFACIAAVLSGSIFGDHCSPVTDTTILSSLGSGCDNIDHVRTQLPYALTVAVLAALVGYLPAGFGVSPAISIPAGLFAGALIIRFVGKKVEVQS